MDEILSYLNENIEINAKGKGGVSPGFKDGIKHDKEVADLMFPLIDQIVTMNQKKESVVDDLLWKHFP